MADTVAYVRDIPVKYEVDVLVVGGGPAGCAAAWAAGRMGADVLLIEGQGALGGMGTVGAVPAFMQFGDGKTFLARGFGWQLLNNLQQAGGMFPETIPADNRHSIGIRAEILKCVLDEMLLDAGVKLSFCTQLIDVQAEGRNVTTVVCAAKSGVFGVRARTFVDCTGDGDLCAWAGAEYEKGDDEGNMMPGTLCSLYCNIDFDKMQANPTDKQAALKQAFAENIFTIPDQHLPGFWMIGGGVGGGNISHAFGLDSTDEASLTEHFVDSRRRLREYETFYKKFFHGFDKMQLVATGALMGVRESRRIVCETRLEASHFLDRASFADEIGRYCYPVDIHISKPDPEEYAKFMQEFTEDYNYDIGESYGIPYGCLIPRDLDNVLVAGRCVGSDRQMQGSIRVMPGCFITGQAAGVACVRALDETCQTRRVSADCINAQIDEFCA